MYKYVLDLLLSEKNDVFRIIVICKFFYVCLIY